MTQDILKKEFSEIEEDTVATDAVGAVKSIEVVEKVENTKAERIHYLYCITNLSNNKIYIGQTIQPHKRWNQHKNDAKKPKHPIQFAINKYGVDNFKFEVIACCKGQDNANDMETLLVTQYDSFLTSNKGYNSTHGGYNAPKTDLWKQSFKKWRESLSEEEKQAIRDKQSKATQQQIEVKGHPAAGHKWTEEQRKALSEWRSSIDQSAIFTPEIRQKMRDSHLGKKLPKEQVEKIAASRKITVDKKNAERYLKEDIRCHAEGCEVKHKAKYRIINGVRYCRNHADRVLRTGQTELQPRQPVIMTEETRQKISISRKGKGIGRIPHNKAKLSEEQIQMIVNDPRSILELSKVMNIGRKVINRIRREHR